MAKAKATAKAKPAKASRPEGPRARNDAYVMMLFITFIAIVGGTVLMYLDYEEYGSKVPDAAKMPAVAALGAPAAAAGGGTTTPPGGGVTPPGGGGVVPPGGGGVTPPGME